jgi:hypothetical protein
MTSEGLAIYYNNEELVGTKVGPDSFYVPDFMSKFLNLHPQETMDDLMANSPWVPRDTREMLYRGNELNRTKFFLVKKEDGTDCNLNEPPQQLRRYRYPGWQWASMFYYRIFDSVTTANKIADEINSKFTFAVDGKEEKKMNVNHIIGTHYTSGEDCIGFHADKVKFVPD